ncbi:hypothetical protein HDU87_005880 [Geranomyces variabilis]|uniref:Altered inheritance of mitochondria protein 24, mitochondrial n=1 Tax=Geranomyces variabilis TaxID=109894 RepID=A0AAD5TS68_9FUNG|nr:hypothetical protein HDU87_005880 [Geranomyces variabilis]
MLVQTRPLARASRALSGRAIGVQTLNARPARVLTAGLEAPTTPLVKDDINVALQASSTDSQSAVKFSVLYPGSSSVLRVDVPAKTHFFAAAHTTFAKSEEVQTTLSAEGGLLRATVRRLAGGAYYREKFQTEGQTPGHVFIAPRKLASIAAIQLDGTTEYCVRQRNYLASTSALQFSPVKLFVGEGIAEFLCTKVSGEGVLAFSGYGALHRISLAPGERFIINRRYLVAFETSLAIVPSDTTAASPKPKPLNLRTPSVKESQPTPPLLQRLKIFAEDAAEAVGRKAIHTATEAGRALWAGFGNTVLGRQEYYRFTGPGDFYITSRLPPATFSPKR